MTAYTYLNKTKYTGEYKIVKFSGYPTLQISEHTKIFLDEALESGYELVGVFQDYFIFWISFGVEVGDEYLQARKNSPKPKLNRYFK